MSLIVVTGAAGFIGQHLVRYLVRHTSARIVGLDNLRRGRWDGIHDCAPTDRLALIEGDVRDADLLQRALKGADTIFHLAAQSNVIGAALDTDYSFQANVVGTYNVLRAARAAGVRRVIFTSSREVYGEPAVLPVPEDAPLVAKNFYGASKIAGEAYCRVFDSPEMRVSVVRLANVYGPGDRDRVIPIFFERIAQGRPLVLYGGDQVIDFAPIGLVVEALWRAAETLSPDPINIGSGQGTALKDLAQRMLALTGSTAGIAIEPARPIEVRRFIAQIDRMKDRLGLTPPGDPLAELDQMQNSSIAATRGW